MTVMLLMLLMGSYAARHHYPQEWRMPVDLDLMMEWDHFQAFVIDKRLETTPISKNKFVAEDPVRHGRMIEIEIAWPGSSGHELLQRCAGRWIAMPGVLNSVTKPTPVLVPTMDWLFTIKASHRFKKDDPHFLKTLRDYHRMKKLGCKIADPEWLAMRESETYLKRRPRLNSTKDEFFTDDSVVYTYDHDTLHLAVAHLDQPAYEFYKADDAEVMCSRRKWDACSDEIRCFGVLEESYVLALERSQIPHGDRITPRDSFLIALSKVCTSITSGWFREFAYENYYRILEMYSDEYVDKFRRGLEDGTVRRRLEAAT